MAAASVLVTYTIAYTFKIFRPGPNSWAHCNPRSLYGERPLLLIQDFVYYIFQSTLPLRGATQGLVYFSDHGEISIHAPLAGSDLPPGRHTSCPGNFNPRSPCGERRPARNRTWTTSYFNPRSPCGERRHRSSWWCCCRRFQSTLPLRGATREQIFLLRMQDISIHAPLAGSDMTEIFMAWSK